MTEDQLGGAPTGTVVAAYDPTGWGGLDRFTAFRKEPGLLWISITGLSGFTASYIASLPNVTLVYAPGGHP